MEVDERLLRELEEMGFSKALATKALSSGNSTIEDAINWIIENDPAASETPTSEALIDINIEASDSFNIPEQVKSRAQELRNQARKKKAEQEKKLEREREKDKIRAGKEAKQMVEESERKRLIAQRKAEKEEEKRAREKIRQKLQQDKLERQGILGLPREIPVPLKPGAPLQITKNLQPVDPAFMPVKPAALREHMRECLRSLKHQNKDDNAKAVRAFQTLFIYVRNIVNNPDEEKFRKIRISNPVFQDRVGIFKEGIEFLELCGFEIVEGGNFLFLPQEKVDMGLLKLAGSELQNALTNPFFGLLSA